MSEHFIIPKKTLVSTFIALLFLTFITVWIAQFDFGAMNAPLAILIASVKAALVAAFFMGLKYSSKLYLVCLISSFFFLILFFALAYLDEATRVLQDSTL